MTLQDLIYNLEYMRDRTNQPCYNQLESGFRHSELRPHEIMKRKDECLEEITGYLSHIINDLKDKGIE